MQPESPAERVMPSVALSIRFFLRVKRSVQIVATVLVSRAGCNGNTDGMAGILLALPGQSLDGLQELDDLVRMVSEDAVQPGQIEHNLYRGTHAVQFGW